MPILVKSRHRNERKMMKKNLKKIRKKERKMKRKGRRKKKACDAYPKIRLFKY